MNALDHSIIAFLNSFAHRSWTFDNSVGIIGTNYATKTCLLMALICWAWFRQDRETAERRSTLLVGLMASCSAVLVARILSFTLPFRERPLRRLDIDFVLPYGVNQHSILGWSAFPSDNASLYFGVATCIFLVSRRAGIVAFLHTLVAIVFTRVYLGYHHPTDMLGGALIGITVVSLSQIPSLKAAVVRVPMQLLRDKPELFYAAAFLVLFFIGTTFDPLYPIASSALSAARAVPGTRVEHYIVLWLQVAAALAAVFVVGWIAVKKVRRRAGDSSHAERRAAPRT